MFVIIAKTVIVFALQQSDSPSRLAAMWMSGIFLVLVILVYSAVLTSEFDFKTRFSNGDKPKKRSIFPVSHLKPYHAGANHHWRMTMVSDHWPRFATAEREV